VGLVEIVEQGSQFETFLDLKPRICELVPACTGRSMRVILDACIQVAVQKLLLAILLLHRYQGGKEPVSSLIVVIRLEFDSHIGST
jgi:hypothetical protein